MLTPNQELVSTVCFVAAVVHTFITPVFALWAGRFKKGSLSENLLNYFAEVEVVFGLWALVFLLSLSAGNGLDSAVNYLSTVNFTEACFVAVIMAMASTKPVMSMSQNLVTKISRLTPKHWQSATYFGLTLTVAPLLGSFITEPAAMVVAVLLLKPLIFDRETHEFLRYSTLAVLLVNVSIGGTLSHFAAPPVIMVAHQWQWDFSFMLKSFGWKSSLIVVLNSLLVLALNFKFLRTTDFPGVKIGLKPPLWLVVSHLIFMALVVRYHSSMAFFIPLFLLFLGWTDVTKTYQEPLKIRDSLLVGFFIGGLVTLGQSQGWWLKPLIASLSPGQMYLGAAALTAVTDNAALTYLGTLVPDLSLQSKYLLVAGAVAGGGLTVIANAPNPIAVGLLKEKFTHSTVNPVKLFLFALPPTIIALLGYWFLG